MFRSSFFTTIEVKWHLFNPIIKTGGIMYCGHCGSEMQNQSNYCKKCGQKYTNENQPDTWEYCKVIEAIVNPIRNKADSEYLTWGAIQYQAIAITPRNSHIIASTPIFEGYNVTNHGQEYLEKLISELLQNGWEITNTTGTSFVGSLYILKRKYKSTNLDILTLNSHRITVSHPMLKSGHGIWFFAFIAAICVLGISSFIIKTWQLPQYTIYILISTPIFTFLTDLIKAINKIFALIILGFASFKYYENPAPIINAVNRTIEITTSITENLFILGYGRAVIIFFVLIEIFFTYSAISLLIDMYRLKRFFKKR